MGHITHVAIVVTSWSPERLDEARFAAAELDLRVSELVPAAWNGRWSMLVAPDGAKSGTEEATDFESRRAEFVVWLRRQRDDDDGSPFEWVAVAYGDDDVHATNGAGPPRITDHEWADALEDDL